MGSQRTYTTIGIILKRMNYKDTDRIVTILTQEQGKITAIARGARKMTSSKRAFLEPGMEVKGHFVKTKGMPILTQVTLEEEFSAARSSLEQIRQLSQILEIIDALFVEEELDDQLYASVRMLLRYVCNGETGKIRSRLAKIIAELGYQPLSETKHTSFNEYVAEITGKSLNSWSFLRL